MRYVSLVRIASFGASSLLFGTVVLGLVAASSSARANGRFPESNAIFFAPNDPDAVLLRTTFGLITSHDRGKTWDWVCERSIGLAGVEDPMFEVTPDGTMLSSTFQGLAVSHDRACNWAYVGGDLKDLVFIDLTSRPSTPGNVVAFASSYNGQDDAGVIFFKSTLFETKDEGKTFATLGPDLDPTLLGSTVDVAPSDANRIYVSAKRNPGTQATAFILTSKDHGKTFEEHPLALVANENGAYIAAVDPLDADRLYVRTSSSVDMPSRLLLSDDAGKTFRTIYTGRAPSEASRSRPTAPRCGSVAPATVCASRAPPTSASCRSRPSRCSASSSRPTASGPARPRRAASSSASPGTKARRSRRSCTSATSGGRSRAPPARRRTTSARSAERRRCPHRRGLRSRQSSAAVVM